MYTAFLTLPYKKQAIIRNAALKEFATKGYETASTNAIVTQAGISKGSLFRYFGTKEQLLAFLLQYMTDIMTSQLTIPMENMSGDVIERWRHVVLLKIELLIKQPLLFDFSLRMVQETHPLVQTHLKLMQDSFTKNFGEKLYSSINTHLFRDQLDVPKVLKLIWWGLEGYAHELQQKLPKGEPDLSNYLFDIQKETNEYLDILKEAYYR